MRHSRDGGARPRTRQTSVTLWGTVKRRLMLRKDIFSYVSDKEPSETIGVVTEEKTMEAESRDATATKEEEESMALSLNQNNQLLLKIKKLNSAENRLCVVIAWKCRLKISYYHFGFVSFLLHGYVIFIEGNSEGLAIVDYLYDGVHSEGGNEDPEVRYHGINSKGSHKVLFLMEFPKYSFGFSLSGLSEVITRFRMLCLFPSRKPRWHSYPNYQSYNRHYNLQLAYIGHLSQASRYSCLLQSPLCPLRNLGGLS